MRSSEDHESSAKVDASRTASSVKNWDEVFDEELRHIFGHASHERQTQGLMGIALSGGGVRAASFSLGVFQALIAFGVESKFHYLSTVSGGGYLGAAVAWLRKKYGKSWTEQFVSRVGVRRKVDQAEVGGTPGPESLKTRREPSSNASGKNDGAGWVWLDYIRQHSNYLKPPKLELTSLIAVAVRNTALSVGVYIILTAIVFAVLVKLGVLGSRNCASLAMVPGVLNAVLCLDATSLAYAVCLMLVTTFIVYSLGSFVVSLEGTHRAFLTLVVVTLALASIVYGIEIEWVGSLIGVDYAEVPPRWSSSFLLTGIFLMFAYLYILIRSDDTLDSEKGLYWLRVVLQKWGGRGIELLIFLTVLAQLDVFDDSSRVNEGLLLVAAITFIALLFRLFIHRLRPTASRSAESAWYGTLFAGVVFTGAIGAYVLAQRMVLRSNEELGAITAIALAIAFFTNLNQFGIGRMYRDRLMEAFMPDTKSIEKAQWRPALEANTADGRLAQIWDERDGASLYPIFNTNVVLIDSEVDRYRNRGGDSFVLTPKFCGSNATGWVETRSFADRELKAGTAMAISGAAANPNAAIGGYGFTRNRFVAFLMFLGQARLGAWVANPNRNSRSAWAKLEAKLLGQRPNFISPGIRSGLLGQGQHEKSHFLELTDGGHFDNTGAYELIRRRAKLIVLVQASQDHDFSFKDLANLAQKVRVDFGARLFFRDGLPLEDVVPVGRRGHRGRFAERGHAIARIKYAHDGSCGWLVYLQATPLSGLPVDVHSYHQENGEFPNEPTANQFFREAQLEAYRELGYAVAKRFLMDVVCEHRDDCSCKLKDQAQHVDADRCLAEICKWLQPKRAAHVDLRGRTERPKSNTAAPAVSV